MSPVVLKEEIKRRQSQTHRLLEAFKEHGSLNTAQINALTGTGCSSRIHELRKEGHIIVSDYVKPGLYNYTYKGQKQ